jgi:hypothetical protein
MRESFDDVEINPACPKCGQGIARRFGGCVKKAASTASSAAHGRSALRNIEQVREELIRVLEQDA